MACDRWTEALSAIADGEDPGVDQRLLDAHLQHCERCREFQSEISALPGPRTVGAAPMPDLSKRVIRLNAIADRASQWGLVRGLLAIVAIEVIVLSLPEFLLGQAQGSSAHAARHIGAFSIAYAAALLVAAIRPARARSILPVATVLAGALAITAAIDIVEGRIPLLGEAIHIPEILSVGLLWMLATPGPRRWRRQVTGSGQVTPETVTEPTAERPRRLRSVDDSEHAES